MENKIIELQKKTLIEKLSPTQKEYLEALDWFYNGGRGSGRTYLSCTVAIIGLLNGNHQVFVLDHYQHDVVSISHTKAIIHSIANEIKLSIEIKDVRGGFIVRRSPEYIQWEQYGPS